MQDGRGGPHRMIQRRSWMVMAVLLVWTALYLVALRSARGQTAPLPDEHAIHAGDGPVTNGGVDQNRDPRSFERAGATDGDKKSSYWVRWRVRQGR